MFTLDKLILNFVERLITDTYTQFVVLTGLFVISELVYPSKKVRK